MYICWLLAYRYSDVAVLRLRNGAPRFVGSYWEFVFAGTNTLAVCVVLAWNQRCFEHVPVCDPVQFARWCRNYHLSGNVNITTFTVCLFRRGMETTTQHVPQFALLLSAGLSCWGADFVDTKVGDFVVQAFFHSHLLAGSSCVGTRL
jgi:hypothetical protein